MVFTLTLSGKAALGSLLQNIKGVVIDTAEFLVTHLPRALEF